MAPLEGPVGRTGGPRGRETHKRLPACSENEHASSRTAHDPASASYWVPVSGRERRGRIARRSRWLALAAAATHEPHTIVSASRRRPRGSPRSSASDEGVARNRLPSAEKATSGGPGGQRRPRSGRPRHEGGVAVLQGGEGIAVP